MLPLESRNVPTKKPSPACICPPSRYQLILGGGLPLAMQRSDTGSPGWSVSSMNVSWNSGETSARNAIRYFGRFYEKTIKMRSST